MTEREATYRLYDADGNLLYIGRTRRLPLKRWDEHEKLAPWWRDVVHCELDLMDPGEVFTEERRAILDENPRHNRQRYPLKARPRTRVWECLTEDLNGRLAAAGRQYRRTGSTANREALAAVIYEAFLSGCAPMYISNACRMGREDVRKLAAAHGKRNPGLPPLPRRHGTGSREYIGQIRDGDAGDTPPKRRSPGGAGS